MRAPTTGSRISGATCRASRSRRLPPDAVVYLGHGPADAAASVGGMLTKDQKGTIAELAITREAIRHGIDVYAPSFSGGRYDLIFGFGARLLRIQCKWARLSDNVITIRCYSSRRGPGGHIKRSYRAARSMPWRRIAPSSSVATSCRSAESTNGRPSIFESGRPRTTRYAESIGPRISNSRLQCARSRGHSSAGRAPAWHAG